MNAASPLNSKLEDVSMFLAVYSSRTNTSHICIQDITPHEALHELLQDTGTPFACILIQERF